MASQPVQLTIEYDPVRIVGRITRPEQGCDSPIWERLRAHLAGKPDVSISIFVIEMAWPDILGVIREFGSRSNQQSLNFRFRPVGEAEDKVAAFVRELRTTRETRNNLAKLGLPLEPRWMAIEDNTVGYDVLSYNPGKFGPLNKLIEVKSTIASPLRFFLSRNEWEQASKFGKAYVFHVWDIQKQPAVLYEKTVEQIAPHVPQDNNKGHWKTALIPVGV
jgi:hypothetical protein